MTLGEIIKKYRSEHDLSMRDFENISGISRGYLSMLEKNENPRSKKPITPSIDIIKQVALATGRSFDQIFDLMDNQEVSLKSSNNNNNIKDDELQLLMEYRRADDTNKEMIRRILAYSEALRNK